MTLASLTGFACGVLADVIMGSGLAFAWLGWQGFYTRRDHRGLILSVLWVLLVGGGPIVLFVSLATYVDTPLEFAKASGTGALVGLFLSIFIGSSLNRHAQGYWETNQQTSQRQRGRIWTVVDAIFQRFYSPGISVMVECSISGMESFLRQLGQEAQTHGDEVIEGTLTLRGLEYEIPTKVLVGASFRGGGMAYMIPSQSDGETKSSTEDETHIRRDAAKALYQYVTDVENVVPGTMILAMIHVSDQ